MRRRPTKQCTAGGGFVNVYNPQLLSYIEKRFTPHTVLIAGLYGSQKLC